MGNPTWTKEQEALLVVLASEGLSGFQIAKAMGDGRTRNAIIGKAHRMGLNLNSPFRGSRTPRPRHPRIRSKPMTKETFVCGTPLEPAQLEFVPRNLSILEVGHNQCRYCVADNPFQFCALPTDDNSSWCREHQKIVWT